VGKEQGKVLLPFGIIVNQDIVFHGQLEVWDFLTDPSEIEADQQ
jgi:hypothetical protein